MSRNLCRVDCVFCEGIVRTSEAPRPITREEAGAYWQWYEGMLVARAACVDCEAPFLAWVDETNRADRQGFRYGNKAEPGQSHFDLSHYHAFNDEPAREDMPRWRIEVVRQRHSWPHCYVCAGPLHHGRCHDHKCVGRR
jgi:hypothetical protein